MKLIPDMLTFKVKKRSEGDVCLGRDVEDEAKKMLELYSVYTNSVCTLNTVQRKH